MTTASFRRAVRKAAKEAGFKLIYGWYDCSWVTFGDEQTIVKINGYNNNFSKRKLTTAAYNAIAALLGVERR